MPAHHAPNIASIYAGALRDTIATRSPARKPVAASAAARHAQRCASARYDSSVLVPTAIADRCGHFRAARIRSAATLRSADRSIDRTEYNDEMSVPSTMRHVVVREPGPPDVMAIVEGPVPAPRAGEVVIEVAWAGVNRPDCAQRAGTYPPPPDASPILGLEVSGRVVACGTGVEEWKAGDDVCALTPGGGYAQYCTTPAAWCLPVPHGLSLEQAASLPETFFTVWNNVFDRARLAKGETFLVHGGTSGIGITAIQLAKAFGATVITTAGNAEKVAFCRQIGADHAIDYRTNNFETEFARITAKRGVDVILDIVGGDYAQKNPTRLALEGRLVPIAFMQGHRT